MRSWRSGALALLVAACGTSDAPTDTPDAPDTTCETSYLDYANFGEPFLLDWCRGCHSAQLPADMRQMAPIDVDFDTKDEVMALRDRVVVRATGAMPTMPPAGGPSTEERAALAEWIRCGGK